jgi:hypothetical protein
VGISNGMGWQIPCLPGLGDGNWEKIMVALKVIHYDYVVSIEHEDRNYEGDEELVKRGFYLARDMLKPYIYWNPNFPDQTGFRENLSGIIYLSVHCSQALSPTTCQ